MLFDCLKDEICVRRKYTNCADELSWVAAHVHNPRQIVLKWKVKHLNEWVKGIKNWNKDQADRMRGRGGVTPFSLTKLLNLRIFSYLIMNMNRDTKGQILEVFDWGRSWKKSTKYPTDCACFGILIYEKDWHIVATVPKMAIVQASLSIHPSVPQHHIILFSLAIE